MKAIGTITPFEFGKDPISIRDDKITEKDFLIKQQVQEIENLKITQDQDFVPRVTKEKLEENLKALEVLQK